jgi:hypothetical protein
MAAKKPNKVNSGTATKEAERLGKATMYIGYKTAGFTCPTCNRNLIKGIIYEHNSEMYCSRGCIAK